MGIASKAPRVSIVIPCFNGAATLGAAIESGLAQERDEVEIIVVDDGSTDRSLAIARTFEPAIRVLTGSNRGVSAARNCGIAEFAGEWIIFLDADDLLVPGTIKARLAFAAETDVDVVISDWREFSGPDSVADSGCMKLVDASALAADPEIACATHVWAPPCALMYRRTVVENIGGFREDLPVVQDARFLFDAAYTGARFAHFHHVGAYYRVLPDSLSRRDPAKFWRDVYTSGKQIETLWRVRNPLSRAQWDALEWIYNSAARNLFLARDRKFFDVLATLRASGLYVWRCNRGTEIVSHIVGQSIAVSFAECWTMMRLKYRRLRLSGRSRMS